MKYRIASLFAAAAMLLSLFSCVSLNLPKAETTGAPTETETEYVRPGYDYDVVENDFIHEMTSYLNALGNPDYGTASLMIATPKVSAVTGEDLPLMLSEEIALRNREVENKLNIMITSKYVSSENMYDALESAVMSGEFFADILMIPQDKVGAFAVRGLLQNMKSLPFSDFESGFNMKSGVTAASAASSVWAVGGWATLDPDMLSAVFFNKQTIKDAGLEDPYLLRDRGEWTWDKFFEYAKDGCAVTYAATLPDAVFASRGGVFATGGLGVVPKVSFDLNDAARSVEISNRIFEISDGAAGAGARDSFAAGERALLIDRLGAMKTLYNSKAVWGILPMPKSGDEQDGYVSLIPSDALMFAVPRGVTGPDKISRTVSAMNICSLGYLVDAYLTDAMNYYLRDNSSIASAETVCYGARWDMAYTAANFDDVAAATYDAVRNGDVSDEYREGANDDLSRLFP